MKLKKFAIILSFIAANCFSQAFKPALINPSELEEGMMYIQLNHLPAADEDYLEIKACTVSTPARCFHLGAEQGYPLAQVNAILQRKIKPIHSNHLAHNLNSLYGRTENRVSTIELQQAKQFFIIKNKINGPSDELAQSYFSFAIIEALFWELN